MDACLGRRNRRDDWTNTHPLPVLDLALEEHLAINERKERKISAHPYVVTGLELCPTLTNQNIPTTDNLAAKALDPKSL